MSEHGSTALTAGPRLRRGALPVPPAYFKPSVVDRLACVWHPLSAIGVALLEHRLVKASPWALGLLPLVWLYIGSRFRALGNMMHECAHSTFVRGRRWNRWLGNLLSFFDFTDFKVYAEEHFTHHRHLGDERDLDFKPRRALFARLGPLGWHYVGYALTLRHLPSYIRPVLWSRGDSVGVRLARLGFNLSLVALAHFGIGWTAFALYYLIPYLAPYQLFRFLSDAFDHAGMMEHPDALLRARNHIHPSGLVNTLLFPRSDQYHLVHHLFPQVTTDHLRPLHHALLSSATYAALEHRLPQQLARRER